MIHQSMCDESILYFFSEVNKLLDDIPVYRAKLAQKRTLHLL